MSTTTTVSSSAYNALKTLFDEGSFVELGALAGKNGSSGVICGYGAVNAALTFAFAQSEFESGAIGGAEARKIAELYALAEKGGAPIVGIFSGAGARISEGAAVLDAFGKILGAIGGVSGKIPQTAVIDGVCAGMSAVAASMFDFVVAVEGSSFYINAPVVQRAEGAGKNAGGIKEAYGNGLIDVVCPDGSSAIGFVRDKLLACIPQNNHGQAACFATSDIPERDSSALQGAKDIKSAIGILADSGSFVELKAGVAPELVTGFASFDTLVAGVVATERGASLTPRAARKAASFISYCDNYGIPVITLVDSVGADRALSSESSPLAAELARLAGAYSASSNVKITLVLGKAYGAAFTLLGSRSVGGDLVFALPDAEISAMSPEAAVQFMYSDEIIGSGDPVAKRKELTEKWKSECASAISAANSGLIDGIIGYGEARAKLISALYMLWDKAQGDVVRRHTKLPF